MVSIKVGVRHTVPDNQFCFSFLGLSRRTLFIDESPLERAGGNNIKLSSKE